MTKDLYIDFHSLVYRYLHVMTDNIKEFGFGVLKYSILKNGILKYIEQFSPDRVFVCIDSPKTWRKEYYKDYKASRKIKRDKKKDTVDWNKFFNFIDDFKIEMEENFPFYVLQSEGLEADDIISFLVRHPHHVDNEKICLTNDNDYIQLLRFPNTKVFNHMKGSYYECDTPKLQLEIKLLTGDKKDDVPGVFDGRFGPKGAEKLIADTEKFEKLITEDYIDGVENPVKSRYERNQVLLDLRKTPNKYLKPILKTMLARKKTPAKESIHPYFIKQKFRELLNNIQRIRYLIKDLKY